MNQFNIASIKQLIKQLLFRPRGLRKIGRQAWFKRPWHIDGAGFITIGEKTFIREHSWLSAMSQFAGKTLSPSLSIGKGVYIGRYCYIACGDEIVVEDECVLSEHVYITDDLHGIDPLGGPIMEQPLRVKPVFIGRRTFLGYRVAIMPGVKLGEHCVVAANSVVTRSFPAYSMIGGVPARLIKTYSMEKKEWEAVDRSL